MIFFIIWPEKCNSLLEISSQKVSRFMWILILINDFKLITTNRKKEQRIKTILLISHKFLVSRKESSRENSNSFWRVALCEKYVIIGLGGERRKSCWNVSIQLHLGRPMKHRGERGGEAKAVKEITNYYRRRFIEKNWFVLGIAEGDPYRGSLEGPHSGPSLRRIEVYELSMPWFQRRETLQFLSVSVHRWHEHERTVSSVFLRMETDSYDGHDKYFLIFFQLFPPARI